MCKMTVVDLFQVILFLLALFSPSVSGPSLKVFFLYAFVHHKIKDILMTKTLGNPPITLDRMAIFLSSESKLFIRLRKPM